MNDYRLEEEIMDEIEHQTRLWETMLDIIENGDCIEDFPLTNVDMRRKLGIIAPLLRMWIEDEPTWIEGLNGNEE